MEDWKTIEEKAQEESDIRDRENRERLEAMTRQKAERDTQMQRLIDKACDSYYHSRKTLEDDLKEMEIRHAKEREDIMSVNRALYGSNEKNTSLDQAFKRFGNELISK